MAAFFAAQRTNSCLNFLFCECTVFGVGGALSDEQGHPHECHVTFPTVLRVYGGGGGGVDFLTTITDQSALEFDHVHPTVTSSHTLTFALCYLLCGKPRMDRR